jgi:hypothetical protein
MITEVEQILTDPQLEHNIRGRLRAALHVVGPATRARLACDYAEHALWICEELAPDDRRPHLALIEARQWLDGLTTIRNVALTRSAAFQALIAFQEVSTFRGRAATQAAWSVELAVNVCCQRELESLGVIHHEKRLTSVENVAERASYAVALYAGGEHWDAEDRVLKDEARRRGRLASDEETRWQIVRLLQYVQ